MKKLKRILEKTSYLLLTAYFLGVTQMCVYAAEPKFVSGTKNLVTDLTKYALGLVATVTGLILIKTGYQWNMAADEEKPKYKKNFFVTLFVGVGIVIAGSLVTWVFSYYL